MKVSRKIIAVFCCIAITISCLVVPASASGGISGAVRNFFEWSTDLGDSIEDGFWHFIYGDDWKSADRDQLSDAYNSYVSNLQTDLGTTTLVNGGFRYYYTPVNYKAPNSYPPTASLSPLGVFPCSGQLTPVQDLIARYYVTFNTLVAPFDANYICYLDTSLNNCYLTDASLRFDSGSYKGDLSSVESGKNVNFTLAAYHFPDFAIKGIEASTSVSFSIAPYVDLFPTSDSLPTSTETTPNTRAASIVGDYGIIGENGTITEIYGDNLIDESTNTYYNPYTDNSSNITNWAYDYSDRSYHLTTEEGDTVTVTYGDENITINEGDTIYTVYYMVPQEEQPSDPGTDPGTDHTHAYADEITKQPTCLLSGVRTYTCSCGDSYTKTVPATGHDWQISQQVSNIYDPETGEQTQAGYTVYTCATCGEQYKSTDGTAPPNGITGDDSSGGIGGVLSGLLGAVGDVIAGLIEGALTLATKAMEALTGLGDLVSQMIETVLGFFGGFIDFLAAMFPFLPEETFTILNLGLILMIAAAVFRKFLN